MFQSKCKLIICWIWWHSVIFTSLFVDTDWFPQAAGHGQMWSDLGRDWVQFCVVKEIRKWSALLMEKIRKEIVKKFFQLDLLVASIRFIYAQLHTVFQHDNLFISALSYVCRQLYLCSTMNKMWRKLKFCSRRQQWLSWQEKKIEAQWKAQKKLVFTLEIETLFPGIKVNHTAMSRETNRVGLLQYNLTRLYRK